IYNSIRLTFKDRNDKKEKKRSRLLENPYFEIKGDKASEIQIAVRNGTVKDVELNRNYDISELGSIKKSDEIVYHEGDVFFESRLSFTKRHLPQYVGKEDPKGPIMTINFKD